MQKNFAAKKIDTLAISIALFILLYIIFISFFKDTVYCLILSALSLFVLHLFYRIITKNKREKEKIKRSDEKIYNRIFLNLPFYCGKDLNSYFCKLFESGGYKCENVNGNLEAVKDGVKRIVYTCFTDKGASENDIFKCERLRQEADAEGFILLCESTSDGTYKILDEYGQKLAGYEGMMGIPVVILWPDTHKMLDLYLDEAITMLRALRS
jgi:hypothetical protein